MVTPETPEQSPADRALLEECFAQLEAAAIPNEIAMDFYEAASKVKDFGISTPKRMRDLQTVIGWPGTVVDTLEERLEFLGWSGNAELERIYRDNTLDCEASSAQLDALIFGVGFMAVTPGNTNEPNPLIMALPTRSTTGIWDRRSRRLKAALHLTGNNDEGENDQWVFWTPTEVRRRIKIDNTYYERVDPNPLGRVPVVAFINRSWASRKEMGRSEITKGVRYWTEVAARTVLGMEINREYYNAPQRIGLNLPPDMFDKHGPITSEMGKVAVVPPNPNKDDPEPKFIELNPASPAPYLDQIEGFQALLAAEAGIPENYLGLHTSNPASADAIRAQESRLVRRVKRRQTAFSRAWYEVAGLALDTLALQGHEVDNRDFTVEWGSPETATLAATADAVTKLVGAKVMPANSDITLQYLDLDPTQRDQIRNDQARALEGELALALAAADPLPAWPGLAAFEADHDSD